MATSRSLSNIHNLGHGYLSTIGDAQFVLRSGDKTLIECTPLVGVGRLGQIIDGYTNSIHRISSDISRRKVLCLVRIIAEELRNNNIEYVKSIVGVCRRSAACEVIPDVRGTPARKEDDNLSEGEVDEEGGGDETKRKEKSLPDEKHGGRNESPSSIRDGKRLPYSPDSSSSTTSIGEYLTVMDYILRYHHALFHGALRGSLESLLYLESEYPDVFKYVTIFLDRNGRRESKNVNTNDIDEEDLRTVGCSLYCMNSRSGISPDHMIPETLLRVYSPETVLRSANLMLFMFNEVSLENVPSALMDRLFIMRYKDQVLNAIFRTKSSNRQILWLDVLGYRSLRCMNACTAISTHIDVFEFVRSRIEKPVNLFYLLRVAASWSNVTYVLHILDIIFSDLESLSEDCCLGAILALSCFKGDHLSGQENNIVKSKTRKGLLRKAFKYDERVGIVALYNIPEYMSPIEGIILKLKKRLIDLGWFGYPHHVDKALPGNVTYVHMSNNHIASILFREFNFSQEYRIGWLHQRLFIETGAKGTVDAFIYAGMIDIIGEYSVSLLKGFMFLRGVPGGRKLLREIVARSIEYKRDETKVILPEAVSTFVDEETISEILSQKDIGKMTRCTEKGVWDNLYDDTIDKILQFAIKHQLKKLTDFIHARYPIVDWY